MLCFMQGEIEFIEVPESVFPVLGKPGTNTRIHKREGPQEEVSHWYDVLTATVGPTINTGSVRMFVPVSRAALYERILRGKLTMFEFNVVRRGKSLLGKDTTIRERPYTFVPVSECQSWRNAVERRAVEKGFTTENEIKELKPEWLSEFMDWEEKKDDAELKETPDEITFNVSAFNKGWLDDCAELMKLKSSAEVVEEIIKRLAADGFGGLAWVKTGWWMSMSIAKGANPAYLRKKMAEYLKKKSTAKP